MNDKMLYKRISQDEAKYIMDNEIGYLILDVRTPTEFEIHHIKGAINLPNEEIYEDNIEILPDKNQKILVYCRSGYRSLQASAKLGLLGYKNIYEFGGILNWKY